MLEVNHQAGVIVALNATCISLLWRSWGNDLTVALICLAMGVVCYNMDWIDRQDWFDTQYLVLGVCLPCILYIGVTVIFLYAKVVRRMKLLHKLRSLTTAKKTEAKKKQ